MPDIIYIERSEFGNFIEKMKYPEEFLKNCEKFHNIEKRDIIYVLACELLNKNEGKLHYLAAIDAILMIWNMAWYQKTPKERKKVLDDKILKLVNEHSSQIKGKIFPLDKDFSEKDKNFIINIFKRFKSELGPVGATKCLHMLNPGMFPIWDGFISRNYHKYYPEHKHKGSYLTPECYFQFCLDCQKILKEISNKKNIENLWESHKHNLNEVLSEFPDFKETILKMLDECNYANITEIIRERNHEEKRRRKSEKNAQTYLPRRSE